MAVLSLNPKIFNFKKVVLCNGLENEIGQIEFDEEKQEAKVHVKAFKIVSLLFN
jgi:hypothetical protein